MGLRWIEFTCQSEFVIRVPSSSGSSLPVVYDIICVSAHPASSTREGAGHVWYSDDKYRTVPVCDTKEDGLGIGSGSGTVQERAIVCSVGRFWPVDMELNSLARLQTEFS